METIFDLTDDFVERDNRKNRPNHNITKDVLITRHTEFLPKEMLEGKHILDLGCCIGATGAWCLSNGCASYTGVELQKSYADVASELLSKHFSDKEFEIVVESADTFLAETKKKYDLIIAWGVTYSFIDPFSILRLMMYKLKLNGIVSIENWQPNIICDRLIPAHFMIMEINPEQQMNLGEAEASALGMGTRVSHTALTAIMSNIGMQTLYVKSSIFKDKYVALFQKALNIGPNDGHSSETVTDAIKNRSFKMVKWKRF